MESFRRSARQLIGLVLASLMVTTVLVSPAQAGLIGTEQMVHSEQVTDQRQSLHDMLEREDVQAKLVEWGVDPDDAKARIGSLTDEELDKVANRIDELPAGGGAVGAVVFVFVVLLITDILGLTDVFPFVR